MVAPMRGCLSDEITGPGNIAFCAWPVLKCLSVAAAGEQVPLKRPATRQPGSMAKTAPSAASMRANRRSHRELPEPQVFFTRPLFRTDILSPASCRRRSWQVELFWQAIRYGLRPAARARMV